MNSILEFSTSELISLQRIAAHCPQEGGVAIHPSKQARGMLSIIEEGNKSEESINTEVWDLILYPNPIRIKYRFF